MNNPKFQFTFQNDVLLRAFLRELKHWHIKDNAYEVSGLTVSTNSKDVFDVADETFYPENYSVVTREQSPPAPRQPVNGRR